MSSKVIKNFDEIPKINVTIERNATGEKFNIKGFKMNPDGFFIPRKTK